jgi:peroxiredoxin
VSAPVAIDVRPDRTTLPVGAKAPVFAGLLGVDGRRMGFADFADREVLVLIFSSNRCPTAKAYAGRMNAVQRDYGPRGVGLVALNSSDPSLYPDERYERMVEQAEADGYTFPYLQDAGQEVARAYGARCTFHVFVLDRERRLRYQGRFDDSRLEANVRRDDLREALDDLLADRPVRVTETRPFGCSLDFVS